MKNLKKIIKDKKAITLIALVITIVVLIFLAAVAINLSLGNNGIFNRAKTGKELYQNAQEYEKTEIGKTSNSIDEHINSDRGSNVVMKSPPVLLLTAKLPTNGSTTTNFYKGTYLASSNAFTTKTISEAGTDYIEFIDATSGWKIKKSGWYLVRGYFSHNVSQANSSGAVTTNVIINGQKECLSYMYAHSGQVVAQDVGNMTLYFNENDVINFSYEPGMNGSWSWADFQMSALF